MPAPALPAVTDPVEAFILAGGRSSRMGRDKSRLRLGNRSLIGWIRLACGEAGLAVRTIRRDVIPSCGPLSGIVTALRKTRAPWVVILSCDMPFVPASHLSRLVESAHRHQASVFTTTDLGPGFPAILRLSDLPAVERQIAASRFSLQRLAVVLRSRMLRAPSRAAFAFLNLNTPEEWREARERWRRRSAQAGGR